MTVNTALESEMEKCIRFYSLKANRYKMTALFISTSTLLIAAFLPIGIIQFPEHRTLLALMSTLLAMLIAMDRLFLFKDRWVSFRVTALELENLYIEYKFNDLSEKDSSELLQSMHQRLESIISRGSMDWASRAIEPKYEIEQHKPYVM